MTQVAGERKIKILFNQLNKLKVFVVGDAMIDNYWIGSIDRISPEAPVPILSVEKKDTRPGGAANVALNCKALGADVSLLTVTGNDKNGNDLCRLLKEKGIRTEHIIQSKDRITTTKTRIISKNQQIIRLDEETSEALSVKSEHHFIDTCLKAIQIEVPDIVIFEDYNKGVLKENVIEKIITHCKHVGVLTAVDPKKHNFLCYRNVDIFKPNLKEIKEAFNISLPSVNLRALKSMHLQLNKKLEHQITMITLSEHGIFIQQNNDAMLYPAHIRAIADVSGAGDTVIAVASMIFAVSGDIHLMAQIANLAGGLVCEEVGVVPVNKQKLLRETITMINGWNS